MDCKNTNPAKRNLASILNTRILSMADKTAMRHKPKGGTYQNISWRDMGQTVRNLALGLTSLGLVQGDRAAIFSQTSHFWALSDLATIYNGSISVPIYPTCSTSDIEYIVNNSEAKVIFVQNEILLSKFEAIKSKIPSVKSFVLMSRKNPEKTIPEIAYESGIPEKMLHSFEDVIKLGHTIKADDILKARWNKIEASDIATIIYTSGTTGTPKGVPLTHDIIISVIENLREVIPTDENEVYLSYLPMSHVFERICGEFYWMMDGGACAYAEGIEYMARNMQEVEPTMVLMVPRVLDRIYTKVKQGIDGASPRARTMINWSISVGAEVVECQSRGQEPRSALKLKHYIAEKTVLSKLREKLGSSLRLIVSGGAPASKEVLRFFNAVGISTLEGYGLTETAAPLSVNDPERVKIGSVGRILPSVQAKVDQDGELLVKGPTVFNGYYKNDEANKDAFVDGWFRTGDIATIDSDNYITITDRKKDIIVNAAGKNIAPQKIEAVIKTIPFITQAVVFGDKQKHLVALLTLDEAATTSFAVESGWNFDSFDKLRNSENLNRYIRSEIKRRSIALADYEKVKKFTILESDLSVEAGELTATLKIKRNVVAKNYSSTVRALYEDKATVTAK